jgi:multiple sugar transport system permease protein
LTTASAAIETYRSPPDADPRVRRWFAQRQSLVLLGPALGYLFVFSLFPLLYSLGISFYEFDVIESDWEFVGLDHYRSLWSDEVFWAAARTTALMVGVGVLAQSIFGTALALFFNVRLRGAAFVRGLLVVPMILNPVVVGLMWRALLNPDWGLVNWMLGGLGYDAPPNWLGDPAVAKWVLIFVDVWQWTPFVFIIVFARLQALPEEIFEAAAVDGAGAWGRLTQITLPMLASAIVFAGIFRAIDAFRTFDLVYGLTYGGPGRTTTTLSFYGFETGFSFTRYGFSSAIAYVMVVIAAVASSVLLRRVDIRREDAK